MGLINVFGLLYLHADGYTAKDLATRLHWSVSTTREYLNTWEGLGYLKRVRVCGTRAFVWRITARGIVRHSKTIDATVERIRWVDLGLRFTYPVLH